MGLCLLWELHVVLGLGLLLDGLVEVERVGDVVGRLLAHVGGAAVLALFFGDGEVYS